MDSTIERTLSGRSCECGCGKETYLAYHRNGHHVPGEPLRFLPGHYVRDIGPRWIEEDRGYLTPCWIWQLCIDAKGYSKTWNGRESISAHRKSYLDNKGEIPKGYEVDHLCGQKACVNPDHLEAITKAENLWRGLMFKAGLTPIQLTSLREWMIENLTEEQLSSLWSNYRVAR